MNFVMNHAPGAGSIDRPVDQQSRALSLCYGRPHSHVGYIVTFTHGLHCHFHTWATLLHSGYTLLLHVLFPLMHGLHCYIHAWLQTALKVILSRVHLRIDCRHTQYISCFRWGAKNVSLGQCCTLDIVTFLLRVIVTGSLLKFLVLNVL